MTYLNENTLADDYELFLGLSILEIKIIAKDIFSEEIVWENDSYLDEDGEFLENLSLLGELNENESFHLTLDDDGCECIDITITDGKWIAIFGEGEVYKSYAAQLEDVFSDINIRKPGTQHRSCQSI